MFMQSVCGDLMVSVFGLVVDVMMGFWAKHLELSHFVSLHVKAADC